MAAGRLKEKNTQKTTSKKTNIEREKGQEIKTHPNKLLT